MVFYITLILHKPLRLFNLENMRRTYLIFYFLLAMLPCLVNAQLCTEQEILQQANKLMAIGEFELAKDTINFGSVARGYLCSSLIEKI